MKKPVNFRPFLITAVCAIAVVLCVGLLPDPYAAVTGIAVAVLLLLVAVLLGINGKPIACITFSIAFAVTVSCVVVTSVTRYNWKNELEENKEYYFIGTIESKTLLDDGARYFLDDVTANGVKINGKVCLSVNDDDVATISFLKCGDRIGVLTDAAFAEFNPRRSSAIRNGIRYYASADASEVSFLRAEPGFFDKLRNKMSDLLDDNLGAYGQVAFGMLTGDKGSIDDSITDYYSISGIGHILSVSGLHVGFVVAIASFILEKLRAGRVVKLGAITAALTFYCFLASFALSVVRASIMCILGLIAGLTGKQRDPLNALCFAVTGILAVQPVSLFDVGFEMSVAAVFGILLFSRSFTRVFSRFLPKFFSSALSVSLSAQIGITPVSLVYFSSFPTYSVLVNLIVIPIVTVAFIAITIALAVTLIVPQAGAILFVAGIPLVIVDDIAVFACKLPLAEIRVYAAAWFMAVFALYFICSQFFMLPKFKPLVVCVCVMLAATCIGVSNIPSDASFDVVAVSEYKCVTTVVRTNGKTFVVGDVNERTSAVGVLRDLKARSIDAVYLNKLDKSVAKGVLALSSEYEIKAVYFPVENAAEGIAALTKGGFTALFSIDESENDEIKPVYSDRLLGYIYDSGTVKTLMLGYGIKPGQVPAGIINECAVIRTYVYDGNYGERIYIVNYENSYQSNVPKYYEVLSDETFGFKTATSEIASL